MIINFSDLSNLLDIVVSISLVAACVTLTTAGVLLIMLVGWAIWEIRK
jgi:hypothetical protein